MAACMPAMLLHEGNWEGAYRVVDLDGNVIDQHESRVECRFPENGPYAYVQKNHFSWPDGREFHAEFGGELRGDRLYWDTDRFSGYGWATLDDVVMLTLDRKDRPGEKFTEVIVLAPDGSHRARTWHWFRDGILYQRTLCDEQRV
jgi:hypothetical protein